jgi:hypothetical protein
LWYGWNVDKIPFSLQSQPEVMLPFSSEGMKEDFAPLGESLA